MKRGGLNFRSGPTIWINIECFIKPLSRFSSILYGIFHYLSLYKLAGLLLTHDDRANVWLQNHSDFNICIFNTHKKDIYGRVHSKLINKRFVYANYPLICSLYQHNNNLIIISNEHINYIPYLDWNTQTYSTKVPYRSTQWTTKENSYTGR